MSNALVPYHPAPPIGTLVTTPFGDERLGAIVTSHDTEDPDFFEAAVVVPNPRAPGREWMPILWPRWSLLVSRRGGSDGYSWSPVEEDAPPPA